MVVPAVNAFTAKEPGMLTKPLSKMNNFVSYDSIKASGAGKDSNFALQEPLVSHVTPETKASTNNVSSPQSSWSTNSNDSLQLGKSVHRSLVGCSMPTSPSNVVRNNDLRKGPAARKRSHSYIAERAESCIFLPAKVAPPYAPSLALRPEHYRAVSRQHKEKGQVPTTGYQYSHIPLTYMERKRLSDTLFFLSRDMPTVSHDISLLLKLARERNEWDLAIAEILTQVIVAQSCAEGDLRLEGLQKYLLRLGIAC